MKRFPVLQCLETIQRDLQLGNSAKAEGTLLNCYKYLQELVPNDFSTPSSEELQIISHSEKIHIEDAPWISRNGAILLPQKVGLFPRCLNVLGVLALKMCHFDISVNTLEQSVKHIDDTDDEELNFSLGIAQNNLACVYISKGCFQKAKGSLDAALESFKIIKNSTKGNVVKENIVTVLNNLRQVHQVQRNYIAEQVVRNELLTNLHQVPLSPRIIASVEYNEACTSLENRNLRKALNELEKLKIFCEIQLPQSEEVINCISLKICLVHLLLGNSSKAAAIINTETLTLLKLIELLNVRQNFLLDFSVTVAETLVDICINQGNLDLACKLLAYLVTICRERCGANHPTFAAILRKQGLVFSLMGKTDSSRQSLTDAAKIFTRAFGAVHPDVLKCEAGLARLESSDGLKEKSVLHSQRVLENVEKICQVSFKEQLKEKFEEKFEQRVISIPETDQEEHLKLERLISEFSVEIASVLSQHPPSDLGENIVSLEDIRDRPKVPVSCYPEEICAKLSFNFLNTGLWFFNLGMVAQSTVFLLLSCSYTEMFHDCLECSDVMLVQVILVLCHLKARRDQRFTIEKQLRNEFKVLRNFIEERSRQHDKPERKSLFFEEAVNLKVSLALFLRSFAEMEMFELIEEMHELFSRLQNHHSQKMTNIFLVEELRFVFFTSKIECLGRVSIHDLIFTTPLTVMHKVQNFEERKTSAACQLVMEDHDAFHKDKTSKRRQPKNMFRTLALTRGKIPFEKFCSFIVYCPVSYEVDVDALNQINECSVKSIQDTLPPLILSDHIELTPTQYFVELEPLVSLESDIPLLLGDLSLLPLILSPAKEAAKTETQPLAFINAVKTCERTVAFTFPDRATTTFLFGQLVKQIFTNLEKLAEITDVGFADNHLVLKIQSPFIGQIVMQCVEDSIKIKTQFMYVTQSPAKLEIFLDEKPPCSCPIVKMFFGEEMERCAVSFGIVFEERIEKDWCIASLLPEKAEEMEHKTLTVEGKDKLSHPASPLRIESHRENSHQTLSYEENVLSESCTQTDSLSIPVTFESGTQTDECVENPAAGFATNVSDIISDVIPVKDLLTFERKKPEDINIDPHGIFGNQATTLLKESPPDETTAAEKFNWPPFVPGEQGDSKPERHKQKEHNTIVYGTASETKDGSNTSKEGQRGLEGKSLNHLNSQSSFDIPLTSETDQYLPCAELPTIEQPAVKPSPTDDWRNNVIRDVTNGPVNREMAGAGKPRHDVTDGSSYMNQANTTLQAHPCLNSSTTSVKLLLKEEDIVPDDSPRHTRGIKGQSTTSCSLNDALKLDEPPNWSRNQGAKPKTNVQGSSDVLSSKKKVDKVDLLERVEESEYFGIRPVFLARHTDDSSISMTSDDGMWKMEDTEERPSDILSRYQRFGCYPDRSYHTPTTWPPPLPLSEYPNYSAGSQGPILGAAPNSTGNFAYLNLNEQPCHRHSLHKEPAYPGYDPFYGDYPGNHNVSVLNLQPPPPLPIIPCDESEYHHALMNDDFTNRAVQSRSKQAVLAVPSSTSQAGGIGQSAGSVSATFLTQNVVSLQAEASSTSERAIRQQGRQQTERHSDTATTHGESTTVQTGLLNGNSNLSDEDSLAALERRVAEACSLVERVLKEREEREKAMRERERRQREERAQREQRERERREREERQRLQSGGDTSTGNEEASPSQSAALPANPRWLCEHYQRLCRVKFNCCGRFYPCHRCHNNSDQCVNDNCKAKEAFYIECSICRHQQPIDQHAQTCARCKTKMSAYFCSICKHFTGEDKYPYHCTKCGICRIHKDRSFHCDVCNVCLDKRLQGKHKCRANSGHDECCICLEDAFSGCQILPCSHKVHRECAIAMIQNGVRSCPICRHPLYSQTGGTN